MPSYVSKGTWYPAKEIVGLVNKSDKAIEYDGKMIQPGQPFVYEGPCREAMKELDLHGHEDRDGNQCFGTDIEECPEFLEMLRKFGYNTDAEGFDKYYKSKGYDKERMEKEFNEKVSKVQAHEIPKKVNSIKMLGGGKDFLDSSNNKYGNFGQPSEL